MLFTNYSEIKGSPKDFNLMPTDCRNWYAVQTMTGQEKKLVSMVESLFSSRFHLYLPVREVLHRIKGSHYRIRLPIFPGYVFVYKYIDEFVRMINDSDLTILAKPVRANGVNLEVDESEMKLLFDMTGEKGVINISKGVMLNNQRVKIVKGPLKNFQGKILFINKRKNKAKVRMEMMNRVIDVSLGLEIIDDERVS